VSAGAAGGVSGTNENDGARVAGAEGTSATWVVIGLSLGSSV
jgi:hypothetical protein